MTTLRAIGTARDAAMTTAAQLLKDGRITKQQWDVIANFHDHKLMPAYRLAVAAAKADLNAPTSADLMRVWQEFFTLVSSFQKP